MPGPNPLPQPPPPTLPATLTSIKIIQIPLRNYFTGNMQMNNQQATEDDKGRDTGLTCSSSSRLPVEHNTNGVCGGEFHVIWSNKSGRFRGVGGGQVRDNHVSLRGRLVN